MTIYTYWDSRKHRNCIVYIIENGSILEVYPAVVDTQNNDVIISSFLPERFHQLTMFDRIYKNNKIENKSDSDILLFQTTDKEEYIEFVKQIRNINIL